MKLIDILFKIFVLGILLFLITTFFTGLFENAPYWIIALLLLLIIKYLLSKK